MIEGLTHEGRKIRMNYTVAPVRMPLDSVSQICDSGATVVFTKTGGTIIDSSGAETRFFRDKDTYVREMWIPADPRSSSSVTASPFRRPRHVS